MKVFCSIIFLLIVSGCNIMSDSDSPYEIVYENEQAPSFEQENTDEDQITVAIVPKLVNIPYFNAVEKGAREAAEDLNVNVIYKGPPLADSSLQIEIIEDLIKQNVDLLAVSANDPEKLAPVLQKARQLEIKVITWDSDTLPGSRDLFINMVDPETLGRHLMDLLAWNTNEQGKFAIMTGSFTAANLNEWVHWINIQHEEYYSQMTLVDIVANDEDPHQAYILAKELLKEHPDLDGIIGSASEGPPAIAKAVKELGKSGEVAVVGLASPSQMNEYLKDGTAQAVTLWSPKKLGYLTVAISKNVVEGKEPYDRQDIPKVGKIRMIGDTVIMGEPIDYTKDNVDQYDF
ncbi:autoinducer 2 ABC transporter substrate-binding protein [Alkalihalobacterium bogoriense]|uniref:autoinducer 2 ABC transporter substrate-binding protein n=1 Tax=Alkalihalobacterium bogoriense TaxID=246272 RepID=UPI000A3FFF4F|nr:autoinducer 2 ABC transporter substrate-binding protein [Alkalihalobacterium bogoriense]